MSRVRTHRRVTLTTLLALTLSVLAPWAAPRALADHTTSPASVTIAGSLQNEAGCAGDWDPTCAATQLVYDAEDDVWQGNLALPAGDFEYKAALNNDWAENYGANATQDGANIGLGLAAPAEVKFYYDHKSHWVTSSANARIVVAPGSFQSELGCAGDWDPACLRSWLQDPDGDGIYTLETTLPAGNYEGKAAIGESWSENYGAGGVPDGPNIGFSVPADDVLMRFSFDSASNTLSIRPANAAYPDNNVEWDGLRHDSRDPLYRTPGGAVEAGTEVTIRLRSFHNDITAASLRIYDVNTNSQRFVAMEPAATDVSCYQAGLEDRRCDFWAATLSEADPNNLWYRFVVSDGSDTDYYADNTAALDGGLGAASDDPVDYSYALMFYAPDFSAPTWARDAVIYQIFPDRFRNGESGNDPVDGDVRYDDPVIALDWGTYPEGYCRNYADGDTNCPWRYDENPPESSPTKESPRGRDYYGGDLEGVIKKLDYLESLGVGVIYFNPIFAAGSNHRYDTRDYYRIDPYLGSYTTFRRLVNEAQKRGIRIILDNVFNHMSSDSAFFDRYGHYDTLGACESAASIYRDWFNFRPPAGLEPAPCAPSTPGGNDTYYAGWFGFDSIPEIKKTNPEVVDFFVTGDNSVARYWLRAGAAGWRLDVMGDASFPPGYWETFRDVTKATRKDSVIIGELWQKDSTLLRHLRGETADATMNYRLRDATIGLLAPGNFDSKGFADSGRVIAPSEFAARILSIREDYPDAAYYSLMNLLGSHDTERILWTLTPGAETLAEKQENAANLAEGKRRLQLASLIQYTMPGAPTVYYGDEVGVTGDDDPDDRRTYPWADRGGKPDQALLAHYKALSSLRDGQSDLVRGDIRVLLADDAAGVVAYARKYRNDASIVLINRSSDAADVTLDVAGFLPEGTLLRTRFAVGAPNVAPKVQGGSLSLSLPALSGLVLTVGRDVDLTPPPAPIHLRLVEEGDGAVALTWSSSGSSAIGYNLYRSPLSGGGWEKLNATPIKGINYTDTTVENGRRYFYSVRAVDAAGNESAGSPEVSAIPSYRIGWANLQWPPTINQTVGVTTPTPDIYGQVWIDGVTGQPGPTAGLIAQLGYGQAPQDLGQAERGWSWIAASFNVDAGNNDEFRASFLPEAPGTYYYSYRYSTDGGRSWLYVDLNGPLPDGVAAGNPGVLTVLPSDDTSAPATPSGLTVLNASPAGVELAWDAVEGDDTLYGYEVARADDPAGPFTQIARVTEPAFTDTDVLQGATYHYAVRAVDLSFNRSAYSAPVAATAELRTVSLTFNVSVPASTDATGREVHIAGFLNRLDPVTPGVPNPEWDPGGIVLTRVSDTLWQISLTGKEGTQIEYKYALGSWDFVEKGASCDEIANRQLTLAYGANGEQQVNDTVPNWRNVAPCGN